MNSLLTDFLFAVRLLLKSRRFTAIVVLTLAIGIASNTIIFSTIQSAFLRPMPYPDAGRLVYVSQAYPGFPEGGGQFSYPIFRDIQQLNTSSLGSSSAFPFCDRRFSTGLLDSRAKGDAARPHVRPTARLT